jgi:hypothetical protein
LTSSSNARARCGTFIVWLAKVRVIAYIRRVEETGKDLCCQPTLARQGQSGARLPQMMTSICQMFSPSQPRASSTLFHHSHSSILTSSDLTLSMGTQILVLCSMFHLDCFIVGRENSSNVNPFLPRDSKLLSLHTFAHKKYASPRPWHTLPSCLITTPTALVLLPLLRMHCLYLVIHVNGSCM